MPIVMIGTVPVYVPDGNTYNWRNAKPPWPKSNRSFWAIVTIGATISAAGLVYTLLR